MKKYVWLMVAIIASFALIFSACKDSGPKTFQVTFEMMGRADNITRTVEDGAKVAKPADPVAADYDFEGWYTTTNWDDEYDFNAAVKENFTLYAKWTYTGANAVVVTFDTMGGSQVAEQRIGYGDTVAKPSDPTKPDFIFKDWYVSPDSNADLYDFDTPVTEDITIYAHWDASMILHDGFNWMVIDDNKETHNQLPSGRPVGNSTIAFVNADDIDGMKVFAVAGQINNGFEYGFALLSAQATDETIDDLRRARRIRFWIQGDGQGVDVKLPQDDIKGPMEGGTGDSAYYYKRVMATATPTQHTLTIPVDGTRGAGSDFAQPGDWGVKKDYDQDTLEQINFQTTRNGTPGAFAFRVWGFELLFD